MRAIMCVFTLVLTGSIAILSMPVTAAGQQTLATALDIYVFPSAGQTAEQQSKDEASCYNWAVQNSGSDPFELNKKAEQQAQQAAVDQQQASQAGAGSGTKGAVRGALFGALIGEVVDDDAGKGAGIGAAVGLLSGRKHGKEEKQQAQQQAQQDYQMQQQANAVQRDNFKRAFSVCLEAKNYMVK